MKTAVLILAAGEWDEWYWGPGSGKLAALIHPSPLRHLVPIAREPLIVRTVEHIKDFGYAPIVVTQKPKVQAVVPDFFVPAEMEYWPQTFLSTQELWKDKTYILQGDAFWKDEALEALFAGRDFPRVWAQGCGGVCAWAFLREHWSQIVSAMEVVIEAAEAEKNLGHPSDCYRALEGDQFRNYTPEPRSDLGTLQAKYWAQLPAGSYVDFDWPIHYLEFLEANPWARS